MMESWQRSLAAVAAVVALVYGGILGWNENADGIATAAAFAVGLLFAIVALAGILPASIKVGEIEFRMQQAREEGKAEGKTEGMAQGAQGVAEVAALRSPDDVLEEMTTALPTQAPNELKQRAMKAMEMAVNVTATAANTSPDEWELQAQGHRHRLMASF